MKKIAILGGTFDPIHEQHLKIATVAYQKLKLDSIWIIPTKLNPLKQATLATDQQRIDMIKLAIADYPFIELNEYEITQSAPINYTIDTIHHFQSRYPDVKFYFLIGADNLAQLHQWKAIDELSKLVKIVVVNRKNYSKSQKTMNQYDCFDLEVLPSSEISSTLIRNGEMVSCLNRQVLDYINRHLLYVEPRLRHHLDEKRYHHSINVGLMSQKLAQHYQIDEQAALIAGTYHDIAKQWTIHQLQQYLQMHEPAVINYHHNLYHAYAGAYYLEHHYQYHDQTILNAIRKHTSGALEMNQLELIVMIADKISIERNYEGVETLRELAFVSLEQAFSCYLKLLKQNLLTKNQVITDQFNLIYDKWTAKGKNNDKNENS